MLQSEAGYIDARPQTDSSTKTSCNARPDHTFGSKAPARQPAGHFRSSALSGHIQYQLACLKHAKTRSLQRLGSCSARNVKRASPLGERASEANVHVIRPFSSPLPLQSLHFPRFAPPPLPHFAPPPPIRLPPPHHT